VESKLLAGRSAANTRTIDATKLLVGRRPRSAKMLEDPRHAVIAFWGRVETVVCPESRQHYISI